MSVSFRRLPALGAYQAAILAATDADAGPAGTGTPRKMVATGRYRNDPYRAVVTHKHPRASPAPRSQVAEHPVRHPQPPAAVADSVPPADVVSASQPSRQPTPPPAQNTAPDPAPRRLHTLRSHPLPSVAKHRRPAVRAVGPSQHVPRAPLAPPAAKPPSPAPAAAVELPEPYALPTPKGQATSISSESKSLDGDAGRPRPGTKIALIHFKRTMMSAVYDTSAFPSLTVGETVVVQGDRGEHIATITRACVRRSKSTPTTILRYANEADLEQLRRVREDETIALETCRAHAHRLGLDTVMTIVDVEFQLDFHKLTVFFQAKDPNMFVDFRNLQRALYQHFRCRIWIVDS